MMTREEAENQILQNANTQLSAQAQEALNKPLGHPGGITGKDREFLTLLVGKIEKKEINLYQPSSLLNHSVYDRLSDQAKAKAELNALNLLNTIREIYRLWQAEHKATYQLENLVNRVRVTKERLEEAGGDIYII
jgi:hypothetical protein